MAKQLAKNKNQECLGKIWRMWSCYISTFYLWVSCKCFLSSEPCAGTLNPLELKTSLKQKVIIPGPKCASMQKGPIYSINTPKKIPPRTKSPSSSYKPFTLLTKVPSSIQWRKREWGKQKERSVLAPLLPGASVGRVLLRMSERNSLHGSKNG